MSHAHTIRAAIENDYTTVGAKLGHEALDALVAENQQLRDALEMLLAITGVAPSSNAWDIASAALDGTPSAAQTLEEPQTTRGTGSS